MLPMKLHTSLIALIEYRRLLAIESTLSLEKEFVLGRCGFTWLFDIWYLDACLTQIIVRDNIYNRFLGDLKIPYTNIIQLNYSFEVVRFKLTTSKIIMMGNCPC